ncbi:unnamed protein product, partial [Laminaria digitata]
EPCAGAAAAGGGVDAGDGWVMYADSDGFHYFWNEALQESRWADHNFPPQAPGACLNSGIAIVNSATPAAALASPASGGPSPAYANTPTGQAWDVFDEASPVHSPGWPSPRNSPEWNSQRQWGSGVIQAPTPRSSALRPPPAAAAAGYAMLS